MRKYTLLLSVAVHVVAACALIIAPLFAAASLPAVRDALPFTPVTVVHAVPPAGGGSPARTRSPQVAVPTAAPIPTEPPDAILPETPVVGSLVGAEMPGGGSGLFPGIGSGNGLVPGGDPLAPPQPVVSKTAAPSPPVHIGSGVVAPRKTRDVSPIYPPIALAARREGIVILEAVIAEDGTVRDVKVLRSVPLLDQAAIEAVRQWRFTPTLLSGQPVPIVMNVTVDFKLN